MGHSLASLAFLFCLFKLVMSIAIFGLSLFNFTLSSGSWATALDEDYVSTYFFPLVKGGF